ncbi:MAG TPA: glycosyltransferase [Acidobacteriota bacterium]|nr:glycosyltransferase [Acidobacteriota bacterium]
MPPEISFVVPSYKSRETIQATIESIYAQRTGSSFEVIVVDSSGDDTADWLQTLHPALRVIRSDTRLFAGAARNLGARESTGLLLAFLDADAVAHPDWLESLLATLDAHPEISLIGGAIANANPETTASRILHWIEFSEYLPGLPSGFREALSSSNLLVRRDLFLDRGGFDENYGMAEDLLLCRRWREGLFFEGKAQVAHKHRCSWKKVLAHLWSLGFWSGRYRAANQVAAGAWLRKVPFLCFGLPLLRTPRILSRLFRSSGRDGLRGMLLSPALILALFYWTKGFYRGIKVR